MNSTQASRSTFFSQFTLSVIAASCVLSVSRIMAHWKYYHAPMSVTHALEAAEVPRLLNVTGHISLPPPSTTAQGRSQRHSDEDQLPRIDLGLIENWDLRLCVGKEWYRFPGHFLVPDGVRVDWIKSEFDGMLPGHFAETSRRGGLLDRAGGTRAVPKYLNDLNAEAPQLYVSAGFVGCSEAGGVVTDSICFLFSPPPSMACAAGREGGRGGVRLPARPRLPPSPDAIGARAPVHRGREDVGAGDVPAVPGCSALAAADAHALDAGRAVAAEQRVWGVLPAETPGERGEKGEGAHGRGPGVKRSDAVAGARTVSKARAELHGYLFYVGHAVMLIPFNPAESRVRWRPV